MVTMDDTVVLCTVVAKKDVNPGQPFFPLSVHYQEKTYAVGKIPGGFFKREGRPTEKETLTSRLIDRPIRPLFPKGFMNEVQVICTVLSTDRNHDPDIAAMLGTSAALSISGVPFNGPIGAARVGFNEEQGYFLNPTVEELTTSELDMVVAGTEKRRADGGVRSARTARRRNAGCRTVWPPGDAGRDRRHQRADR